MIKPLPAPDLTALQLEAIAPARLQELYDVKDPSILSVRSDTEGYFLTYSHVPQHDGARRHRDVSSINLSNAEVMVWIEQAERLAERPNLFELSLRSLGWSRATAKQVLGLTESKLQRLMDAPDSELMARGNQELPNPLWLLCANVEHHAARLLWVRANLRELLDG